MASVTLTNGTTFETGCIFAGHRGHYIGQDLVQLALNEGWKDDQAKRWADAYPDLTDQQTDQWDGVCDDAEAYLQSITPEGYAWGWLDGEYFFMSTEWWEEQS